MTSCVTTRSQHIAPHIALPTKIDHTDSPDPLHTVGYKIFKAAVKIPESITQEAIQRSEKAGYIFNHNESARNDHKRRQCTLSASNSSKRMKGFLGSLNQFISDNVSDSLKPSPWVVIHSKPGCQDQAAHCDYVPDSALAKVPNHQMPLAVLVSIMPGTCLNVWPNSIKLSTLSAKRVKKVKPIRCKVEKLNPGDMLVFRGDLAHAGSRYKNNNCRLHTFLDSDRVKRRPNRTWIVHTHGNKSIKNVILPK